jgi:hypothetical protein
VPKNELFLVIQFSTVMLYYGWQTAVVPILLRRRFVVAVATVTIGLHLVQQAVDATYKLAKQMKL